MADAAARQLQYEYKAVSIFIMYLFENWYLFAIINYISLQKS